MDIAGIKQHMLRTPSSGSSGTCSTWLVFFILLSGHPHRWAKLVFLVSLTWCFVCLKFSSLVSICATTRGGKGKARQGIRQFTR
ncbi:hypothetical protein HD806DRAFT_479147 [Xylariaceae sp. AK1471]|nr:hypothetical protein HD806DRAFT_479147 [Xylariaceae sp. AK1471]